MGNNQQPPSHPNPEAAPQATAADRARTFPEAKLLGLPQPAEIRDDALRAKYVEFLDRLLHPGGRNTFIAADPELIHLESVYSIRGQGYLGKLKPGDRETALLAAVLFRAYPFDECGFKTVANKKYFGWHHETEVEDLEQDGTLQVTQRFLPLSCAASSEPALAEFARQLRPRRPVQKLSAEHWGATMSITQWIVAEWNDKWYVVYAWFSDEELPVLLGFIKQKNAEKNFIRFVPRWQCESPYYEAYGSFTDDSPWHRAKNALLRDEEDAY